MTERQIYLSRRNLLTLLSKLDRNKAEPGSSACTLVKYDTQHPDYPSACDFRVTAVEDDKYYAYRDAGLVHPMDNPDN